MRRVRVCVGQVLLPFVQGKPERIIGFPYRGVCLVAQRHLRFPQNAIKGLRHLMSKDTRRNDPFLRRASPPANTNSVA
jgi:hypothetical protein